MLSLRPGNVRAALGADAHLAYLVARLRRARPDVALHFRGDCGFGVPAMHDVPRRLAGEHEPAGVLDEMMWPPE
jgi:hypothetical protein